MKIVITGAAGLIGWHAAVRLHARNCAARFKGETQPFDLVALDHAGLDDPHQRRDALRGADAVLHFAGVNRASDADVESGNPAIADTLLRACQDVDASPHIVYANSTHATLDTPYGRSKRRAHEILAQTKGRYTNLILPHIFGECARPHYNNVTATFIDAVIAGQRPQVNPDGRVALLHAGAAAEAAIAAVLNGTTGELCPVPHPTGVPDLLDMLSGFHRDYRANIFPDLGDPFDLALFNSYRAALYPSGFPRPLSLNTDPRGTLFEAVKGGGGGQTFLSWTKPGVTRGDHFHLNKVERFLVLEGEAVIRIRRVLHAPVWEYRVSGDTPAPVDMPTLHTHNITNVGDKPLLTLFWTHDLFDPAAPDTYADPVVKV
ncbi:polysaccharide biosynthesis C-terminal domain-containing protein [Rhodobacter ferrooxidans]|uniref:NAD-dependent epimerase/dehydratase n=1 Tax=Rhodobacter ferrooxidans TaxID=371731 RepID=C8RWW1_9RHOB|nr:NAD-dependent epimerase/dehydratase family protein [Rhodobacter sp. SW2]EEW27054.1 NAD-dependent epimerase/dehydratase [Rhodobacter sp. SW2]